MSNQIQIQYFKTALGELILGSYKDRLCLCDWHYRTWSKRIETRISVGLNSEFVFEDSEIIRMAKSQLNEYFEGQRKQFDIPLLPVGSEFQKKVWNELLKISFGKTMSYIELSRKTGDEKAIRAVASANGANAISIFIPCHRIIGSHGELTGYAGGIQTKKKLLELEGSIRDPQLKLF
jgi:methylated-DNA-[protein]-cysteine S-methyltransferase